MLDVNDFSYFYGWYLIKDDKVMQSLFAEFAENGGKYLVITSDLLERFLQEPFRFFWMQELMKPFGLKFHGCHGIWGGGWKDLNCDNRQARDRMISDHKLAMGYAADAGCKNYVVHIGANCCYYPPYSEQQMRDYACDTLDQLLPVAEKLDLVLAVENSFEPTNTTDEVLYYINKFPSKHIGVCYDAGHANVMAGAGKDDSKYENDLNWPWNHKIIHEDHALEKLAPHIVTCHLHDNDGFHDSHNLPGTGTINWPDLISKLSRCPRITSMQCEVSTFSYFIPIRRLCETFNELKKYMA